MPETTFENEIHVSLPSQGSHSSIEICNIDYIVFFNIVIHMFFTLLRLKSMRLNVK
jgi:hypothetical protein